MSINYDLWNTTGESITIPTNAEDWPAGDALVDNFVYNQGKLAGFVNTSALVANESKSTTFPYDYVNITVDKSLEGVMTFNQGERTKYFTVIYSESGNSGDTIMFKYKGCKTVDDVEAVDPDYLTNDIVDGIWTESLADLEDGQTSDYSGMFTNANELRTFHSDLSSLQSGYCMFSNCANMVEFEATNLNSLTNGGMMFRRCTNLTAFTSNLSSLTNGNYMFEYCTNLTIFTSDLSSLTKGTGMFVNCTNLTAFTSDLSSLTKGDYMFQNCHNLTTFTSDLSSLTKGYEMFHNCYLREFSSNLCSLTNGYEMFQKCYLSVASLANIAETINDVRDLTNDVDGPWYEIYKTIHIGIGNSSPSYEESIHLTQIQNKGWDVYVNGSSYDGSYGGGYYGYAASASLASSAMTLDEIGETEMFSPKPYWAKPINTTEKTGKYIDSEGNYYNILGAQFIYVSDPETYGMFLNEEDAAAQMRLTKIGEEPIETA